MPNTYDRQAATALRVLTAKGQKMVLHKIVTANYDPMAPAGSGPMSVQNCPAFGAVLPVNTSNSVFDSVVSQDPEVRRSLRYLIVAGKGLTFEPRAQDILLTAEGPYRIIGVTPLNPDGAQTIIYSIGASLDVALALPGAVDNSDPDIILDGGGEDTNDTLTADGGS